MHKSLLSWNKLILEKTKGGEGRKALRIYKQMREEGVIPDHYTFVAALKACSTIADLKAGKEIHAHVIGSGQVNIFVSNTLLDMHSKCGSIEDARQVFDSMRHRSLVSWTAMIIGYAQMEMGHLALELYARMHHEGFAPDARTFVAALKACASLPAEEEDKLNDGQLVKTNYLDQGRAIHAQIVKSRLESDLFVANGLVGMYAKCGSVDDARQIFEKMTHRDVVSWNAIIMGYAHMEMGDLALQLYARMPREGCTPDTHTFVAVLKACASLAVREESKGTDSAFLKTSYLEQGRAIHSEVAKRGFQSNIFVANTLVDMYAKCGSIEDARQVFDKMSDRNVVSWNAMIIGYAHMDMGNLALELYARMQHEGFTPEVHTFVAALKACASLAAQEEGKGADSKFLRTSYLEQGRSIHIEVEKRRFEWDIYIASTLVDMYAKCGSIEDASRVFEKMKHRNVVSWTAMIIGYAQMDMGDLALDLYARMQNEGFEPNARTFVAAIKACASLATLESKGTDSELLKISYLEQGRAIHAEATERGFESDIFFASTLVDMYAKYGSIEDARHVFEKMRHRDVVSWNGMILGYAQTEMGDLALELYARMHHEGYTPDVHTYVAVLQACGSLASLKTGKDVHLQICKVGLQAESFIAVCLIDMYGKCGSMCHALQIFSSLHARNSLTWNAIIAGYSGHGDSDGVFNLYKRMQQEDSQPDSVTFISILNVCSHNGLVDKGQMYFQAMCSEYGIFPSRNHYSCMIDLLGRSGHLDKAASMAIKMPFEPDIVVWTTVLGACQKWNNVEMGRNAFKCAMILDEKSTSAHVLMTNICLFSDISWECFESRKSE